MNTTPVSPKIYSKCTREILDSTLCIEESVTGEKSDNNLPVARGGAVVKCVARATVAVSIGYC